MNLRPSGYEPDNAVIARIGGVPASPKNRLLTRIVVRPVRTDDGPFRAVRHQWRDLRITPQRQTMTTKHAPGWSAFVPDSAHEPPDLTFRVAAMAASVRWVVWPSDEAQASVVARPGKGPESASILRISEDQARPLRTYSDRPIAHRAGASHLDTSYNPSGLPAQPGSYLSQDWKA